jgi:hypothetical protein
MSYSLGGQKAGEKPPARYVMVKTIAASRCAMSKRCLTDLTSCQTPMVHVRRRPQQALQAWCTGIAHPQKYFVHQAAKPVHSTHWHSAHSQLFSKP